LTAAGKSHWIKLRENVIEAKGKGKMQTYWLKETNTMSLKDIPNDKQDRLVDWMVEILLERLKPMVST
jgi:hypothetical protein